MRFSTIKLIIIIIFFNPFLYTQDSNQDLQLIYKEKIKKKIPEKNKLDRKKKIYWELSNKLFHRFTFNSHISKKNPANLAIKSPFYFFYISIILLSPSHSYDSSSRQTSSRTRQTSSRTTEIRYASDYMTTFRWTNTHLHLF